jgi:hypothetical protein
MLEQILDDCALTYKHIMLGMPALIVCCFDWLGRVGSERKLSQLLITTCTVTIYQHSNKLLLQHCLDTVIAAALSGHSYCCSTVWTQSAYAGSE